MVYVYKGHDCALQLNRWNPVEDSVFRTIFSEYPEMLFPADGCLDCKGSLSLYIDTQKKATAGKSKHGIG